MTVIKIMRKFWLKSTFFEILTKIEIIFSQIVTKIQIKKKFK